jgi:hypothetical protein
MAQPLFEAVGGSQHRVKLEITLQPGLLLRLQIPSVTAHQRDQTAVFAGHWIQLPPKRQEVMIDEPDDMEPVGHNLRIREAFAHKGAVGAGQIDTHHRTAFLPSNRCR